MAAILGASVSACLKDNQLYLTAVFENRQLWSQKRGQVHLIPEEIPRLCRGTPRV